MESHRFDAIAKTFATSTSRRTLLRGVLTGVVSGVLGRSGNEALADGGGFCTATGDVCGRDGACCSRRCDNGVCVEGECREDTDCPGADVCQRAICTQVTCSGPTDCAQGQVCCSGVCQLGTCCDDTDCPDATVCQNGACKGAVCASDGDCGTGQACCAGVCRVGPCCPSCGSCQACDIGQYGVGTCGAACDDPCTAATLCTQAGQLDAFRQLTHYLTDQGYLPSGDGTGLILRQDGTLIRSLFAVPYAKPDDSSQTAGLGYLIAATGEATAVAVVFRNGAPQYGLGVENGQIVRVDHPSGTATTAGGAATARIPLQSNSNRVDEGNVVPYDLALATGAASDACVTCNAVCNADLGIICSVGFALLGMVVCAPTGPGVIACAVAGAVACFAITNGLCTTTTCHAVDSACITCDPHCQVLNAQQNACDDTPCLASNLQCPVCIGSKSCSTGLPVGVKRNNFPVCGSQHQCGCGLKLDGSPVCFVFYYGGNKYCRKDSDCGHGGQVCIQDATLSGRGRCAPGC